MTQRRDPFTILRRANPVPLDQLSEASTATLVRALFEEIVATPPSPRAGGVRRYVPRPAYRRHRRLAVGLLALALVSVGWSLYVVSTRPTKPLNVACYEAADPSARTAVVANDGRPPTEICGDLWRKGAFGPGAMPPLVACVLPSGVAAVVPDTGNEPCGRLGAGPLETSSSSPSGPTSSVTSPEQDPLALRDSLVDAFTAEACIGPERAREIAGRELAVRGFGHWTVETVGNFSEERPCASLGFDVAEEKILLIPVPPRR